MNYLKNMEKSLRQSLLYGLVFGILLYAFLSVTHVDAMTRKHPAPLPEPSPMPITNPSTLVPGSGFSFEPVTYYTTQVERSKISQAALKGRLVVMSKCFGDFMHGRALIQTGGKSNDQVVEDIRRANLHIPVEMYSRCLGVWPCTSAVAYRSPPSPTIHLNRNAFNLSKSDCEWASTIHHEASHVLGYEHDYNWNAQRDFSVPYSINKAFTACCK